MEPGQRKACIVTYYLNQPSQVPEVDSDPCAVKTSRVTDARYTALMAQLRFQSQTSHLEPSFGHYQWSSRATSRAKVAKQRSVFTERKSLFPVCNKTQTPRECQGAAPLANTSSSFQKHRDKVGKVRPTAEVSRLFFWALNKEHLTAATHQIKTCFSICERGLDISGIISLVELLHQWKARDHQWFKSKTVWILTPSVVCAPVD